MSRKTAADVISQAVRNKLAQVNTCLPGEIVSYDFSKQKAQVRPVIRKRFKDGETVEPTVISNVPLMFMNAGGASITMPVKRGDSVLLLFSDRDIEQWLLTGKTSTPNGSYQHSLNDCIAIAGLNSFSKASPAKNNEDVLIAYKGNTITIKPTGLVAVEATTSIDLKAPIVNINAATTNVNGNLIVAGSITGNGSGGSGINQLAGTWQVAGNVEVVGDVTADGVSLANHTHSGDSGGTTGTPN